MSWAKNINGKMKVDMVNLLFDSYTPSEKKKQQPSPPFLETLNDQVLSNLFSNGNYRTISFPEVVSISILWFCVVAKAITFILMILISYHEESTIFVEYLPGFGELNIMNTLICDAYLIYPSFGSIENELFKDFVSNLILIVCFVLFVRINWRTVGLMFGSTASVNVEIQKSTHDSETWIGSNNHSATTFKPFFDEILLFSDVRRKQHWKISSFNWIEKEIKLQRGIRNHIKIGTISLLGHSLDMKEE